MVFPKEPVPGQKLDATWGRDVVRALKRLTPSGGPGMRVTCGPNGTTFAAVGRAAQSAATGQAKAEPHPFKAEYFNAGTEKKPNWKLTVFTPDDAVDTSFSALYSQVTECAERAGWAEVEASALHPDKNGLATLTLRFCTATSKEWTTDAVRTYAQFGSVGYAFDSSGIVGFDSTQAAYATLPIAVIDTENVKVVQQLAFSAFVVQTTLPSASSSSGDDDYPHVGVSDRRTDTKSPGLLGLDDEWWSGGNLKLVAYDGLGFDKVVAGKDENQVTLNDYLAGNEEVATTDGINLGKNVNTENFANECLGAVATPDAEAQGKAAPSHHTHTAEQIEGYDEAMEQLKSDIYSNAEFIAGVADKAKEGIDIPVVSSAVPQKDSGTGSAGGAAGAGVAAGDHVHPLNTGTTKGTYAAGDHAHGIVKRDGSVDDARTGALLVVGDDGKVAANGTPLSPSDGVASEAFPSDAAALKGLIDTFDYDPDDGGFTLSTDRLKYPSDGGHSEKCLLVVDENGDVVHSGNDAYDALKDLSENNYDKTAKKVKINYAAIGLAADETPPTAPKAVGFDEGAEAASLIDIPTLAPKAGDEGASADNAPLADEVGQSDGGSKTDIARIGTSGYAARADHVHPVCMEMGTKRSLTQAGGTGDTLPSTVPLDTSTWTPGENGVEESYCSRAVVLGTVRWFLFRKRRISKTGQVVYIGPEYVGFRTVYS